MSKRSSSYELALHGPKGHEGRLELCFSLRDAILRGRLAPGARVPSTRDLALQHRVARGTVVAAYDQLVAEGYLESRVGSGTYVCDVLPAGQPIASRGHRKPKSAAQLPSPRLSSRGTALARNPFSDGGDRRCGIPFTPHMPDLYEFPTKLWASITSRRARRLSVDDLGDADPRGNVFLRREIAGYLASMRGLRCSEEQVIVLGSVQQALDLAARLLLEASDSVLIEDPSYPWALAALRSAALTVCPVPVDDNGADIDWAVRHYGDARLAYVTPGHQAPLGVALSLPRRLKLLEWARRAESWIFEDDYDSEYRYSGKPLPALQSLDEHGRVLYAGCFSKTLFPALRIAYLVVPAVLVDAFASARAVTTRYPSILDQLVLSEFLRAHHYARHLRRMRQIYAERRALLVAMIEERLDGKLEVLGNETGLNVACWLSPNLSENEAVRAAAKHNLMVQPLARYAVARPKRAGLLLGFAALRRATIQTAVETLARALR